jgi:hypothetical protein
LTHAATQVHATKLLSSEVEELLLKLLLTLSKVNFSGKKLSSDVGVNFTVLKLKRWRSQNLVVHHLLVVVVVAVLVCASESSAHGRLGHALGSIVGLAGAQVVLTLTVRSRSRRLSRSRCLRGSTQTSKEMGTAGARGWHFNRVLGNGGDLWRRSNAKALQRSALAARSKAAGGHTNATRLEVVVSHLSKTASVHAHFVLFENLEQRVMLNKEVLLKHLKG